MQCAH